MVRVYPGCARKQGERDANLRQNDLPRSVGAELLRGVLGPPTPHRSPLMSMAATYRRRQRRSMVKRPLVAVILIVAVSAPALISGIGRSAGKSLVIGQEAP